ncbi:MAG: MlaD family protein [bacterium]|nr:MlaD family protein [bacterium]
MKVKALTIGIVVILGLFILIFVSFYMNKIRIAQSDNYILVKFESVDGLRTNDEVRFRGVKCGMVDEIHLANDFVVVKLWMDKKIKVLDKSFVSLQDYGIIGGTKYIFLQPDGEREYLFPSDTLIGVRHDFNLAQIGIILQDIKKIAENSIPEKGKIDAITDTIYSALNKINKLVEKNDTDIRTAVQDIAYASDKVRLLVDSLYPAVNLIKKEIDMFSEGSGAVKRILREDTVYIQLNKSLRQLNDILDDMKKNKLIKGCM